LTQIFYSRSLIFVLSRAQLSSNTPERDLTGYDSKISLSKGQQHVLNFSAHIFDLLPADASVRGAAAETGFTVHECAKR